MEKLASRDRAVTDDPSVNRKSEITSGYSLFFWELDRKKRLSGAWIPLIFFTITLFVISLASPVLALRKGDRSSDVTSLQKSLQEEGYFKGPVTGYYGSLTEAAVKKFQKAKGLNPDGIAGSETQQVIESRSPKSTSEPVDTPAVVESPASEAAPEPVDISPVQVAEDPVESASTPGILKRGDRNSQVASLQKNLQFSGYFEGPITGYYGVGTEEAVIKFQQANRLKSDGIAGPKTRATLESNSGNPAPVELAPLTPAITDDRRGLGNTTVILQRGTRNSAVATLQRKLQAKGYFDGPITGYYGSLTEAAVTKFQKAKGLPAEGVVDPQTQAALEATPPKPTPSPEATPDSVFNEQPFLEGQSSQEKNQENPFLEGQDSPENTQEESSLEGQESQENTQDNLLSQSTGMTLKKTIEGKISPKSIVHSGTGLFFAQNMMYNHSITVYNREYKLVKTLSDFVDLAKHGHAKMKGIYQGAPVEAAFSHNGNYVWVSNYQMYGPGFNNPGDDKCYPSENKDNSFLYKINTNTLEIEQAIEVGSVPKYVATSPDNRMVLVSNWCSWDLSVVNPEENREIRRVKLGRYPRGIVVDGASEKAYVAVMGSYDIAIVDLKDFSVDWLKNIGDSPRHLSLDPAGKYLYATLNGEDKVAKIELGSGQVIKKVATGQAPRSMVISDDGQRLYVVNYNSNTVSKISTSDMRVLQTVNVNANPIGITYDPQTKQVWVACYSGSIMVFQD